MFPLKAFRCPLQVDHVHRPGARKNVAIEKRRADRLTEDAILVGLGHRRMPCVEAGRDSLCIENTDRGGQGAIERADQISRWNRRPQHEACYLTQRMNPGIGTSGTLRKWSFAGNSAKSRLQFALNGGFPRLYLPATEIGAVIGKRQLPVLEVRRGFGQIGHGGTLAYQGN